MTDAAMPPDVAKLIAELLAYSPARSLGTEAAAKIESLAADNAALAARCGELEQALDDMFALYDGRRYTMLEHSRVADRARNVLQKVTGTSSLAGESESSIPQSQAEGEKGK